MWIGMSICNLTESVCSKAIYLLEAHASVALLFLHHQQSNAMVEANVAGRGHADKEKQCLEIQ